MGSLALRPALLLCGNSRPRVAATPLPHATGAHGQLPGRDFNPLDLLLLLRTIRSCNPASLSDAVGHVQTSSHRTRRRGLYPVISCSDRHEAIYRDDQDRTAGFSPCPARSTPLQRAQPRRWRDDPHPDHFVVTMPDANPRGCDSSTAALPRRPYRRHGRVGHRFQGRFKAIRVAQDAHLLDLSRYGMLDSFGEECSRTRAS